MRVVIDGRKVSDFGIGTYIRGLLNGLAEIARPGDEYLVLAPRDAARHIPVEHVVFDAPHYSLQELIRVGRAAERLGADVFHAPHYVLPLIRIPAVVTVHDLIHLRARHRNPIAPVYARTMLRRAVERSSGLLTVSEAVRRDLMATLGAREVTVAPNGVDARFTPEGPRRDGDYFLFVGNPKPHKNVGALLAAFEMLRSAGTAASLIIAGSAFDTRGTGATSAGFVADEAMPALYRGAKALVMPSFDEGFGLPLLEAMACGTPVIASNAPALVEVSGGAAMHVEATDVTALAAAMDRVMRDETLSSSMRARGIERAREFTWRRCAEITRAVYESVFAGR